MLEKIEVIKAQLTDYQVTKAMLSELKGEIDTLQPMIAERDSVGNQRTTATSTIEEFIQPLRQVFKLHDDMVPAFVSNGNFINTYEVARRIER